MTKHELDILKDMYTQKAKEVKALHNRYFKMNEKQIRDMFLNACTELDMLLAVLENLEIDVLEWDSLDITYNWGD